MKKVIAVLFVVALCVPSLFAQGGEHTVMTSANATFTTVYATPTLKSAEVAYIIVESTGLTAALTLTIRDSITTYFTITLGTSADTKTIDLTRTPVLFKTNLNVFASDIDAGATYTIIYRKRN